MIRFSSVLMALAVLLSTSACSSMMADQSQCVSVDSVLSHISSTNGSDISVCGFLKYEFEDRNLYASEKDAEAQASRNCISLGKVEDFSEDISSFSGQWVRVSGVASSKFCPMGTLCPASCSDTGIFVKSISPR